MSMDMVTGELNQDIVFYMSIAMVVLTAVVFAVFGFAKKKIKS